MVGSGLFVLSGWHFFRKINYIDILIIPFHKVLFPGKFFQHGRVFVKGIYLFTCFGNFGLVEIYFLLHFFQLLFSLFLGVVILFVKKKHPNHKTPKDQQIMQVVSENKS